MEEVPVCIGPSALNLRIASPLGVGLWSWGDKWTWGHRGYDAALTESSMSAAFLESMKSGVNFFDTAEASASWNNITCERHGTACLETYEIKQGFFQSQPSRSAYYTIGDPVH